MKDSLRSHIFLGCVLVGTLFVAVVTPRYFKIQVEGIEIDNHYATTIPVALLLVLIECILSIGSEKSIYRFSDAISSLMTSGMQILSDLVVYKPFVGIVPYTYIYRNWRIYDAPVDNLMTWISVFFLVDLGYYWFHRFAHEVNFMWAGHVVHHSSEDYNLSTALRQSAFQKFTSFVFYLPLAFFFHPAIYVWHVTANFLLQFWIHTQYVKSLGWFLDFFLNTPSHHRVHHGRNPYCIDKNYAGILIIWDRIFGTFAAEDEKEEVVYGIVHPLATFDALTIQIHHFKWIAQSIAQTSGFLHRLARVVCGPGWTPEKASLRVGDLADIPAVNARDTLKYHTAPSLALLLYVLLQFALHLACLLLVMGLESMLSYTAVVVTCIFIFFSFLTIGWLLEGNASAPMCETIRVFVSLIALALAVDYGWLDGFIPLYLAQMYIGINLIALVLRAVMFPRHFYVTKSPIPIYLTDKKKL